MEGLESGRKKFGDDWYGSGGFPRADAFSKHFAQHCRDAANSNAVRKRMKEEILEAKILWQGDRIRCMKSSRTPACKICMVERKEILHRFRTDRHKIMNDNSDIFSSPANARASFTSSTPSNPRTAVLLHRH